MKKLYGDKKREKSGISQAVNEIASEVVEKSPLLMKGMEKAEEFEKKIKKTVDQVKDKVEPLSQRVQTVVENLKKNI